MINLDEKIDIMACYMLGKRFSEYLERGEYLFPFNTLDHLFEFPDGSFDNLTDLSKLVKKELCRNKLVEIVNINHEKHYIQVIFK